MINLFYSTTGLVVHFTLISQDIFALLFSYICFHSGIEIAMGSFTGSITVNITVVYVYLIKSKESQECMGEVSSSLSEQPPSFPPPVGLISLSLNIQQVHDQF